jgi:hypothetical protein
MYDLKRLTTEFVEREDRIRLVGEIGESKTVTLWLTQRLINRLIPHVLAWLETQTVTQTRSHLLQDFAQQAARASLTLQQPVANRDDSEAWLIDSIDLKKTTEVFQMIFKVTSTDQAAKITFEVIPLRQWLGIVFEQYRCAQWSMSLWPDWVKGHVSHQMMGNHLH